MPDALRRAVHPALSASAPFRIRFAAYLAERFPPAAHLPVVAVFFASAALVARALGGGGEVWWPGALILALAFFQLRAFDEAKDAEEDRRLYPERLLSRDIITLAEVEGAGQVAILVQAVLALAGGLRVALAWALAFAFSLLMRVEFGAGRWLRPRPFAYAVTHNPVIGFFALLAAACAGAPLRPAFGWFVALVCLAALVMELGRKLERYEADAGRMGTMLVILCCEAAATACLAALLAAMAPGMRGEWRLFAAALPAALSVALLGTARGARRERGIELATAVFLVLALVSAGASALGGGAS